MAVKSSIRAQKKMHRVLSVMALLTILLTACGTGSTQEGSPTPTGQSDWRMKIVQVPLPGKGCFTATYPSQEWHAVPCVTAPNIPLPPRSGGSGPETVGNGDSGDYAGEVTNLLTSATGSFPTVTGVTSETDSRTTNANDYTLQLNTKPFTTSVCAGRSGCQGWQQFVFWNSSARAGMQYWLIGYGGPTCPTGWMTYAPLPGDCWENSLTVSLSSQPITNLASLSLTGTANACAGCTDTAYMGTASGMNASNQDSVLNLASAWRDAEFNVFGAGYGSQANFNANSSIVVRTTVHHGTTVAPSCVKQSYTGETNNLTLVGAPVLTTASSPAIEFSESNASGGTPPSCAAATGIGDTHLRTFSGLFYDFQATGDFLLAQTNNFAVQTRQVSGAPTWPNAAINQEVATQMGKTRVALCAAAPAPLVVDGSAKDLPDGQTLSSPSGIDVFRMGNVYLVTDHSGNSLRAVMNGSWIDVTVGLGTWPTQVRGLLANANGNVNELQTSDGTVLNTPVSFDNLYGRYGESWRVAPADSLLSDCGGEAIENGIPTKPFFARDLPPSIYNKARAICTNAGIKDSALLDACTLDVAVLGNKHAAAVYVGLPAPVAVGETGQTNGK